MLDDELIDPLVISDDISIIKENIKVIARNRQMEYLFKEANIGELIDIAITPQDTSLEESVIGSTISTVAISAALLSLLIALYNKGEETYSFVYYKYSCDNLVNYFKSEPFFINRGAEGKLFEFELSFQKCSQYKTFVTPYSTFLSPDKAFELKTCLNKYICGTFLYVIRIYKDYLKSINVQIPNNIRDPNDLLSLKGEKLKFSIKTNITEMYKNLTSFLNPENKKKFFTLFSLTIQDNFDMARFKFDDFK
ncbi:MAG: hypothetical protein IPH62_19655 [Ignavibacteriae bacterium]|nr:hypothetical protein [Ignavibacteriota bacterium]